MDRRNPEPHIYMHPPEGEPPSWDYHFPEWGLPQIEADLSASLELPEVFTTGYEYEDSLQPYHVEVWCEKSTMNSELLPVCERYAANLVTGVGFMSITSVVELLNRVSRLNKPCRILYLSDFDPAGDSMPVSVARQIEYGIESYAPEADIRLDSLILTANQVRDYNLPRTPLKDTDKRKGTWESIHGEGAVELDALEALYPGELSRIVDESIREFRDEGLQREIVETRREARRELEARADSVLAPHTEELEETREEIAAVAERYWSRLEELNDELQSELAPYQERINFLRQAIENELVEMEPDLPRLPKSDTGSEAEDWLFDARRDYMEQLTAYKRHQRGKD